MDGQRIRIRLKAYDHRVLDQSSGDTLAIRAVFESWYRAMEHGDVAGLMSLVTADVVMKPPGAPPILGKDDLEQALSAFLDEYSESVDYDLEEVEVSGDLGFARILERATIRSKSGADASMISGLHLTVLRRESDGSWLIARNISSLMDNA